MKKLILIALLFIGFNSYAQFDKGGVISLSGVSVFQLDTSARNIIKIIEDERGTPFNSYERFYVNYIVTNLKSTGVWYKCKAIYGMVGGTAAAHKWNWKDMRNLDAAFRLTYFGTITHSNLGIQGSTTSGTYANTFFNPFTQLTINDFSYLLSISQRLTNPETGWDFGAVISGGGIRATNNSTYSLLFTAAGNSGFSEQSTNKLMLLVNKKATNQVGAIVNGEVKSYTQTDNATLVNLNLDLLNQNNQGVHGNPSDAIMNLFIIGRSLTDTQAIQMSNIITFAQSIRANF